MGRRRRMRGPSLRERPRPWSPGRRRRARDRVRQRPRHGRRIRRRIVRADVVGELEHRRRRPGRVPNGKCELRPEARPRRARPEIASLGANTVPERRWLVLARRIDRIRPFVGAGMVARDRRRERTRQIRCRPSTSRSGSRRAGHSCERFRRSLVPLGARRRTVRRRDIERAGVPAFFASPSSRKLLVAS